jgi:hypothetical protein
MNSERRGRCLYCDTPLNTGGLEDECCSDCLYAMSEDAYEQDDEPRCQYCDTLLNRGELEDMCCHECLYAMSEAAYEQHERRRLSKEYPELLSAPRRSLAALHDFEREQKAKAR